MTFAGYCPNYTKPVSLPRTSFWRPKLKTARAMVRLCWAQVLVRWAPFARWRRTLGLRSASDNAGPSLDAARRLAADVEWAAQRMPRPVKCLPQAMALSWMLRRRGIGHAAVIAVRPTSSRGSPDDLHAWIEVAGQKVIGDLPGPWIETLRRGG